MIQEHLQDIDFRSKEERSKQIIPDLISWYNSLIDNKDLMKDQRLQGQATMLSSVLWYLLPSKDYKKLMKLKPIADHK